jgi:cell division septation protein DedD
VTRGAHRVTARVPQKPDAFFTTPSRVEAKAGDTVRFGVAMTPARVFGRVVSDAGDGVGSIGVTLTRSAVRMPATTSSDGTFSFAAAPGEWELAIDTGSLPVDYSTTATLARTVMLDRAMPSNATLEVRANRSVSGRVAAGIPSIRVEPSGRIVPVDPNGDFSIRTLPAGEITLHAGNAEQRLTLPNAPTTIADVTFGTPVMPLPKITAFAARVSTFVVQLGTFRIRANALELVARARRAGIEPTILSGAQYLVVRAGPFESRIAAASVAKRLIDAGLEAVVRSNTP